MKSLLLRRFHKDGDVMHNFVFGKDMAVQHNVQFRVYDIKTGGLVRCYEGHNQATNTMLTGIAHYLCGDGVLNQGADTLGLYVPKYISVGTMGLINQEQDETYLPVGIGTPDTAERLDGETDDAYELRRFTAYMQQTPSYGSDGYALNASEDNGREFLGLGPMYADRPDSSKTIRCELISNSFPRSSISYRSLIPENKSEKPQTIDVVYSAMISTGALAQFREDGKDYIFITEAGLWSVPTWRSNNNGLLAGYRIAPPDENNWDMSVKANRDILKSQIIRVGINQVVQVIWKIQLGSIGQLTSKISDTSIYIGKEHS